MWTHGARRGRVAKEDGADGRRRLCRRHAFPKLLGVGLPRAGIGFDRRRIAAVIDAAIEEPADLIDQPGHELGAIPRPVPVLVVLRHADIDVFLADA
jgi:hypothetical protein